MVNARFKLATVSLVILANFLVITEVTANNQYVCSYVDGQQDCGYVLPEQEANLVIVGTKKLEKPVVEEKEVEELKILATNTDVDQIAVTQQTQQPVQTQPATTRPTVVAPAPTPAPQQVSYYYPQAQGYSAKPMNGLYNGGGRFTGVGGTTTSYLSQMGYSAATLWSAGVKIVEYQGLVPKNCAAGSSSAIAGMAVKPVVYAKCPNGQEVIPASYKTTGKCTVHYDASKGNSKAILAHELSHCLHFIYAEYGVFDGEYKNIRGIASFGQARMREIMADDFMICRHGVDTGWGSGSYYNQYGVSYPSAQLCATLNGIFNRYFAV